MTPLSRRRLLAGTAGLAIVPAPALAAATAAPMRLAAGTRTLEVNGRAARVFRLTGPGGVSSLRLAPEQKFAGDLVNETGVPTIIHWHGQTPPWTEDGFPWPQTPPIPAEGSHRYDYLPRPGTYWMHSHQGLQEQALMAPPLIVHSKAELSEDRQEIVLMLHDFSFHAPDTLLDALIHPPVNQMSGMAGMNHGQAGAPAMKMDLNDVGFDAFLANDRTLADPAVVRVERQGRVRLRVINAAAATQFWLSLGGISGTVVAVDGSPVHPVTGGVFPISMAQRLDILLEMPAHGPVPILAQVEGTNKRTGIILAAAGATIPLVAELAPMVAPPADLSLETRLAALKPLPPRQPDLVHRVVLDGGMMPYRWPGHLGAIIAIRATRSSSPRDYKAQLSQVPNLSHVTIEVETA